MVPLTGLLLLGNAGLALGAVAAKRAPAVLPELPVGAKAQPALELPEGYRCDGWFKVESGKGCWDVAQGSGKPNEDIVGWNSPADPNCGGLLPDHYACVSIVKDADEGVVGTPNGPVQPGIPKDCTAYIRVRKGEGCYQVAERAGVVDMARQVTKWNSPKDPECSHLLPGHYACVAVGSPQPPVAKATKATHDETKAAKATHDETNGPFHAPGDATAGTPAPCRGVFVAVDHCVDVAGSQSHSTQGTVRPGGSLTVDNSVDVAVGPQSPSTQGTVRSGSLSVGHSLEVAVGSQSRAPSPQQAVQPDASTGRVGGSARKVKC